MGREKGVCSKRKEKQEIPEYQVLDVKLDVVSHVLSNFKMRAL